MPLFITYVHSFLYKKYNILNGARHLNKSIKCIKLIWKYLASAIFKNIFHYKNTMKNLNEQTEMNILVESAWYADVLFLTEVVKLLLQFNLTKNQPIL